MLMKWTDLVAGDTLCFTEEALKRFGSEGWVNKKLIRITRVEECDFEFDEDVSHELRFYFISSVGNEDYIYTDSYGKFLGVTLFKVVGLVGD